MHHGISTEFVKRVTTVLSKLVAIQKDSDIDPTLGLCAACSFHLLNDALVDDMFKTWEHFSGSLEFPVPADYSVIPERSPGYAYMDTYNMYDLSTEYGQLRVELLKHCIEYLTAQIEVKHV